uniref:Rho-GAP domain-containing protein n=1 Tax=Stomoxys calcitrans TaxID=35570 RepID=A0A1I8QEZ4_STOCA
MSQEDTTTKYQNNHYQYNNYNAATNNNTMKYENKRSLTTTTTLKTMATTTATTAVALYENFIPLANSNNNKYPTDSTLDCEPNKSAPFIDVQRFVHQTTNAFNGRPNDDYSLNQTPEYYVDNRDRQEIVPNYENFSFKHHLELDKKVLLQKYFRTALVGPRTNIYENLCRGCNYGVFTARGPLCSFCECIVNGVHSISASPTESSNNIYENICEQCAQFYSGNEEDCLCRKELEVISEQSHDKKQVKPKETSENLKSVLKTGRSEENLLSEKKKVKISKSLSFGKNSKPKKLSSFWETLRKNKVPTRKPLEIVHNVGGYDQVFHTKESFDLQRICELKRSATSCSDQHIYGRLKPRDLDLVKSQEDFLSTQSLTQNERGGHGGGKKRRISKVKFLRSISSNIQEPPELSEKLSKSISSSLTAASATSTSDILQAVYLNNSVCHWMSALRHNLNSSSPSVNTCTLRVSDEECDCLCYPKSIPAKKLLPINPNSCKVLAPVVTNKENILKQSTKLAQSFPLTSSLSNHNEQEEDSLTDTDTDEIEAQRRHTVIQKDSLEDTKEDNQHQSYLATATLEDHYQQMVNKFKIQLVNKQVKQQQQQHYLQPRLAYNEQIVNKHISMASAGVNGGNSLTCTNNNNKNGNTISKSNNIDIPLRQAVNSNHNKAKRQGMYLRLTEHDNLPTAANLDSHQTQVILPEREVPQKDHSNKQNESKSGCESQPAKPSLNSTNLESNTVNEANLNSSLRKESPNVYAKELLTATETPTKRSGVHEGDVLRAFEALLRQERERQQQSNALSDLGETEVEKESQTNSDSLEITTTSQHWNDHTKAGLLQPFGKSGGDKEERNIWTTTMPVFDLLQLIKYLQLSSSLNRVAIHYNNNEKQLFVFLQYISHNGEKYKHATHGQLMRKYQRFLVYQHNSHRHLHNESRAATLPSITAAPLEHSLPTKAANSVDLKLDLMKTNGNIYGRIKVRPSADGGDRGGELAYNKNNNNEDNNDSCECQSEAASGAKLSEIPTVKQIISEYNNNNTNNNNHKKMKKPPEVPKRNPNTKLSPSTELLPPIPLQRTKLSPSTPNSQPIANETKSQEGVRKKDDLESIYQPIWKFKTVGEAQERFKTDEDYYTLKDLQAEEYPAMLNAKSGEILAAALVPEIFIHEEEEDHSEWEPDEEFVFTTTTTNLDQQPRDTVAAHVRRTESLNSSSIHAHQGHDRNGTLRSYLSNNSSLGSSSLSGSTITDFASSTATLASMASSSLRHHLFRNVGIFYSLTDKNLCAIVYDYDRIHAWKYFAKKPINHSNDDAAAVVASSFVIISHDDTINDSGLGKSPTPSAMSHRPKQSPVPVRHQPANGGNSPKCSSESVTTPAKVPQNDQISSAPIANPASLMASIDLVVLAWKHQLLNVNYMEDEEDMIVSKSEISQANKIKENEEPQQFTQRFKSRSTDNILDLPLDDEKKTITERMRSRLQRGILNLNTRSSPKSEKKTYKALRNSQTTSLYLEDGLKPKHPIFGAPLDQLELNRTTNVPRFVADSIEYIERKDRIVQDGLYRACGNKFSIDELKQKLTKSYIYDPKLITADDIHTITSLLKLFFRELPQPLIPQETYTRLARDLLKMQDGIDTFRIAINDMPEPNRSTLAFLMKHLTNVAACSASNRMNASNLAIVWGPSLFALNEDKTYDIGRMNSLAKALIENYNRIFHINERLL